jgi:hypothetical protein
VIVCARTVESESRYVVSVPSIAIGIEIEGSTPVHFVSRIRKRVRFLPSRDALAVLLDTDCDTDTEEHQRGLLKHNYLPRLWRGSQEQFRQRTVANWQRRNGSVRSCIVTLGPIQANRFKESAMSTINRRDFLSRASLAGIAVTGALSAARAQPPNEKLNIAAVGIGGMGGSNLRRLAGENIVALCDVDDVYAAEVFNAFPEAKRYKDYREMIAAQSDIDAVLIATPDHTHAVIAMACMKAGKHVFCQKPLTHEVYESRRLGEVREVDAWCSLTYYPWGHESWSSPLGTRPVETPPIPETLDWNLWLGPAPERPYHSCYHPRSWRSWWDFGCGMMGDRGAHTFDPSSGHWTWGSPSASKATRPISIPKRIQSRAWSATNFLRAARCRRSR